MIFYYTTAAHDYTLNGIRSTEHPINKRIKNIHYESLLLTGSAHISGAGVHIFSDIERLPGYFVPRLVQYRHKLIEEYDKNVLFLNHPTRSKRRYELLKILYQQGINKFNIHRLNEHSSPAIWPVFVRRENDHIGPISPLLHTQEELDAFRLKLHHDELFTDDMLVVEFIDTREADGIYKKYSATRIGETILPRHLFLSDEWIVKNRTTIPDNSGLEEEQAFMDHFPHYDELMRIFHLAEIDYGRIDYSIHEGEIQVWEINTNPKYYSLEDGPGPDGARFRMHMNFIDQMASTLASLEPESYQN